MSKGFKISLSLILISLILVVLILIPSAYSIYMIETFIMFLLPVLLVVLIVKNFLRKPTVNKLEVLPTRNWFHTFKITFQSVFIVSLMISVVFFIMYFSTKLHEGAAGLMPFAVLFLITLPAFIIWMVFLLLEKTMNQK